MSQDKKICSIDFGSTYKDDIYTLFEDGRIHHLWDENNWSVNNEEWLNVKDLSLHIKDALLEKCPPELLEQAKTLLHDSTT